MESIGKSSADLEDITSCQTWNCIVNKNNPTASDLNRTFWANHVEIQEITLTILVR